MFKKCSFLAAVMIAMAGYGEDTGILPDFSRENQEKWIVSIGPRGSAARVEFGVTNAERNNLLLIASRESDPPAKYFSLVFKTVTPAVPIRDYEGLKVVSSKGYLVLRLDGSHQYTVVLQADEAKDLGGGMLEYTVPFSAFKTRDGKPLPENFEIKSVAMDGGIWKGLKLYCKSIEFYGKKVRNESDGRNQDSFVAGHSGNNSGVANAGKRFNRVGGIFPLDE